MTKIRRRQRCPKCGSLNIILWGSRDGRQRCRCKDCERSFVRCNENVSQNNRFVWFRRWVLGKQTLIDIAKESGYSERHLRRWFDGYLYKAPLWTIKRRAGIRMLVDGTWLDREHCLIVYRDNASKSTVYYRFASAEKEYEIIKDYLPEISPEKEELVQKIVEIYLHWEEEIIQKYPKVTAKGRPLHSEFDTPNHTSIETYLKGELSSYSVKTLKLYYEYIQSCVTNNVNLAENNLENIVLEKGYKTIDEAEKSL